MLSYQHHPAFSGNMASSIVAGSLLAAKTARKPEFAVDSATRGNYPEHDSFLRVYGRDTVNAQARLIALSLLADGHLDTCEVELLGRREGLGRLHLSRNEFLKVLNDFCADVSHMPAMGGNFTISREQIEKLLSEVSDPSLRRKTLNLMFDLIRSDGKLDQGEAALIWNTLDSWRLRVRHLGKAGTSLV